MKKFILTLTFIALFSTPKKEVQAAPVYTLVSSEYVNDGVFRGRVRKYRFARSCRIKHYTFHGGKLAGINYMTIESGNAVETRNGWKRPFSRTFRVRQSFVLLRCF